MRPHPGMMTVTASASDQALKGIEGDPFAEFCRPKLAELLESLKLAATYERAAGNYLYRRTGRPGADLVPVLDLVGGFGAALIGHNNPELASALVSAIQPGEPVMAKRGNLRAAGGK